MSQTLDITYYAPTFTISIEGSELEPTVAGCIKSLTITKKMGQADNFSFKVQDKMKENKLELMGSDLFSLGGKVTASIGYGSGTTVSIQGHIEGITPKFSKDETCTFDVSGKDKALAILAEESGYKCYTQKKNSEIVTEIAGEVGLTPEVDDTGEEPPEKTEKKGGTSYLSFIQKMVRQNKGYEFFLSDGKLIFRKAKITSSPVKTLYWDKDLKSFEPREDLSRIITGVSVKWWDEINQAAILGEAAASDEIAVGTGTTAGTLAQEVYGDIEKTITDEPVESDTEAKNLAISILCDTNKELVTAEAQSMGVPEIVPGEMIEISGVADSFNGNYYIYAATHTIDTQGYRTEFCIRRNTK